MRTETRVRSPISARAGTLYVGTAGFDLGAELEAASRSAGVSRIRAADGLVSIEVGARRLASLISVLSGALGPEVLDRCPATFVPGGEPLRPRHLAGSRTLRSLAGKIQHFWLRELLDNQRLRVHFQPIVRVTDPREVYGYECLVRADDLTDRLVYPARLFQAAVEAKMVGELDAAAHEAAMRTAAAFGVRERLFLNVHPGAIAEGTFRPKRTVRLAESLGLGPDKFVIEVTESTSLDPRQAVRLGARLRRYGVGIAMDDLGAGYATLNLLADLRPDFVKLDIRLITDVDQDPYRAALLETLVQLARRLGIRTIAEGVETEGQWRWLAAAGVDLAQGYLFGYPAAIPASSSFEPL